MNFTCSQESVSKALGLVLKAVSAKAALPVISGIKFECSDNLLTLTGTNLETTIKYSFPVEVRAQGSVVVPAKLLNEFVLALKPGAVEFALDKLALTVKGLGSRAKFNCLASKDFPAVPEIQTDSEVVLESRTFANSVSSVAFCAATDDSKPVLTGILLRYTGDVLYYVCTDGFRLSEKTVALDSKETATDPFDLLIPARVLFDLARTFVTVSDSVTINFSKDQNTALFKADGLTVVTRLLEGTYPDYRRIVPSSAVLKTETDLSSLNDGVKVANVFAKESSNVIKLDFDSENSEIKISSRSDESGESASNVGYRGEGEGLAVSFNSKYLQDFFNAFKSGLVEVSLVSETTPVVFRPVEIDNYIHLIMPVKTNS